MTASRLDSGGTIARNQPVAFTWDGAAMTGYAGDTLASALLANGVRVVGRSFKYHRPRGIYGSWTEDPNALVDLTTGDRHDPTARATTEWLVPGMAARGINSWPSVARDAYGALDLAQRFLPAGFYYKTFMPEWHRYEPRIRAMAGLGRMRRTPDPRRFASHQARCDVLVIGAGPAGLAAARAAADAGLDVILACDRAEAGGSLPWTQARIEGGAGADWASELAAQLAASGRVRVMLRTTVFGAYDHGAFGLLERQAHPAAGWAAERMWHVRARQAVLASGGIERPLVFPHNDRPGIMSASAACDFLRRYAVLPGRRVLVATTNDSAYVAAAALRQAGAEVVVADARPALPAAARGVRDLGVRVLAGAAVLGSGTRTALAWAEVGAPEAGARRERLAVDLIAVSGGWSPAVHLFSQARGKLRWDDAIAAFVPDTGADGLHCAGAATGAASTRAALDQGHAAGARAAAALDRAVTLAAPRADPASVQAPIRPLWQVGGPGSRQWIDFQNDVTVKDVVIAARENYASVEHLKRYTTLGMATDQGKTSNVNGLAVLAAETGRTIPQVGTTTFRPPFVPVSLGALAGLRHGALHAPLRRLPAHDRHVAAGAHWREYGGWARPACYTHDGETLEAAIQREAGAVRRGCGLLDASSLGKIEVAGPDAAAFLDLIYYNDVAGLKPGRIRYCLLLRETGTIYDDGVVARLAPDRYLLSPSSSHTAGVLAMLEQWHQTEYPALRVAFHDVTSSWATFAVSGPASAAVLARLGLAFDDAALPHMSLFELTLGALPCRLARVSFTGERSYELSVPARAAEAAWDALAEAAAPFGLVPYGIESLSVLRAEKGYILIGTDTDGLTVPDDLGMSGPLRTKAANFVGRRSLGVPEATRPDRRQFVGLLPEDPSFVPAIGSHAVVATDGGRRSLGWITTSCHSPALGRSIALGMIEAGRALSEAGAAVTLFDRGRTSIARVVSPVFHDPAGARLKLAWPDPEAHPPVALVTPSRPAPRILLRTATLEVTREVPAGQFLVTGETAGGIPLGRGRALLLQDSPPADSFASDVTDGLAVFAVAGPDRDALLAMGSRAAGSGRALFAGVPVIFDWRESAVRLHVDRALERFVEEWLVQSASSFARSAA